VCGSRLALNSLLLPARALLAQDYVTRGLCESIGSDETHRNLFTAAEACCGCGGGLTRDRTFDRWLEGNPGVVGGVCYDLHRFGARAYLQPAFPDNYLCLCDLRFGGSTCDQILTTPTTTATTTATTTLTTTPIAFVFTCTSEGYLALANNETCVPHNRVLQQVVGACNHRASSSTRCDRVISITENIIIDQTDCNTTVLGINTAVGAYRVVGGPGTMFCTATGFLKYRNAAVCQEQVFTLNLALSAFQDNSFKACDATTVTTTPTTTVTITPTTPTTTATTTNRNSKFSCLLSQGVSYISVPATERCSDTVGDLNRLIQSCADNADPGSAFANHNQLSNHADFFTCDTSLVYGQTLLHARSRDRCLRGVRELAAVFHYYGFETTPTFLAVACEASGFIEASSDCEVTAAHLNKVVDAFLYGDFGQGGGGGCRRTTVTTTQTTTLTTTPTTLAPTAVPTHTPTAFAVPLSSSQVTNCLLVARL
jgi:hypothetical protein